MAHRNQRQYYQKQTETRKLFKVNINLSIIIFLWDNLMAILKVIGYEVIEEMNREKKLKYDYQVNASMWISYLKNHLVKCLFVVIIF